MERLSLLPISRFVYCTCTLVVKGSKNLLASVRVYPNILYLILCLGIVARLSASPSPQLLPSSPAARWCGTMSGVCVWSCRNQAVCAHKTRAHTRTSEVTRIVTMNIGTDSSLSLLPLNAIHSEDEGESHQESSIEPSMSSHESPRWRSLCSGETEGLKSTADAIQQDYEVQALNAGWSADDVKVANDVRDAWIEIITHVIQVDLSAQSVHTNVHVLV